MSAFEAALGKLHIESGDILVVNGNMVNPRDIMCLNTDVSPPVTMIFVYPKHGQSLEDAFHVEHPCPQ